jgi:hypothetical protein
MRIHLYEYREQHRKLKCSCGWERTVQKKDVKKVDKKFKEHTDEMAAKA